MDDSSLGEMEKKRFADMVTRSTSNMGIFTSIIWGTKGLVPFSYKA
jgi:hypothetical protein